MQNLSRTTLFLAMDPELNQDQKVTACYMLVNPSDPIDSKTYDAVMKFDLSTDNPTLARRTIVGPVLHDKNHKLFVKTSSGISPLSSWVSV